VLCAEADAFSESLATAVCARLQQDGDELRVDLASAGHPPALVLRADRTFEVVPAAGMALALLDDAAYDEHRLALRPGDTLLIHTDGVTEARGALDFFGDDRLHAVVAPLGGMPPTAVVEAVAVAVSEHLGNHTHDDIALLAVQFAPDRA
jgi:serine phosphatase RsbU (regulator of sigma subunit)